MMQHAYSFWKLHVKLKKKLLDLILIALVYITCVNLRYRQVYISNDFSFFFFLIFIMRRSNHFLCLVKPYCTIGAPTYYLPIRIQTFYHWTYCDRLYAVHYHYFFFLYSLESRIELCLFYRIPLLSV
jgi:hypothetical protein